MQFSSYQYMDDHWLGTSTQSWSFLIRIQILMYLQTITTPNGVIYSETIGVQHHKKFYFVSSYLTNFTTMILLNKRININCF